jgi:hypothetical protein
LVPALDSGEEDPPSPITVVLNWKNGMTKQ